MCGACGRPVAADPVFPEGRTTRGNLIAAQMIAALCLPLAGRVKVAGLADGFAITAPARPQAQCPTVGEAWAALLAAAPDAVAVLDNVPDGLQARYRDPIEQRLLEAVIAAGREAAHAPRTARPPRDLAPDIGAL
jgi:hypothetical protein